MTSPTTTTCDQPSTSAAPAVPVSVVILTHDEEANIGPCLDSCAWCDDVHVLDSGSTDRTREVARGRGAGVLEHPFESFGAQRNWAIDHVPTRHAWVFHLDADERFTPALVAEVGRVLATDPPDAGFFVPHKLMFRGTWLRRSSGYPVYQVRLFHRARVRFRDYGHGQQEVTDGRLGTLGEPYLHFNFSKGVDEWLARHERYSAREAAEALADRDAPLKLSAALSRDLVTRRRALKRLWYRAPCRPALRWLTTLFLQGGVLDGPPAWEYARLLARYERSTVRRIRAGAHSQADGEAAPTPSPGDLDQTSGTSTDAVFQRLDLTASYPYRRAEYVKRFLWIAVQRTLFRWSPPRAWAWRRFWLRQFGATLADTSAVRRKAIVFHPWLLTVGEYGLIADGVRVYNLGPVTIGRHTVVSQDAYLCAGTHDHTRPDLPLVRPAIRIGSGVWVAAQAFIGPGVTVGDNAVVAARATVVRDVPAGTVVGGNPARVIKARAMNRPVAPRPPAGAGDGPRLRVLHVLTLSQAGGLSRYVFDLCSALAAAGHDVTVAGARGPWHWLFAGAPFPWLDLPLDRGPIGLWQSRRRLRAWAAAHVVDVVHSHYRRATRLARGAVPGVPVLYTLHLTGIPLGGPAVAGYRDFGDHAHAPSVDARDWLVGQAGVAPDHVSVIPHGVDVPRFPQVDDAARRAARATLGVSGDAPVAAYVGRLDRAKNVGWLLDVAAGASAPTVLLAGEGPEEVPLRAAVAARGLEARVRVLGHRDPLAVYHAADLILLPSAAEGFSLASAEAMCAGVPVLRTRTAGTSELVVEGVTGASTPVGDQAAFAAAAAGLLADPPRLQAMGAAAAARVREQFTFDRQFTATLDVYRRLASRAASFRGLKPP